MVVPAYVELCCCFLFWRLRSLRRCDMLHCYCFDPNNRYLNNTLIFYELLVLMLVVALSRDMLFSWSRLVHEIGPRLVLILNRGSFLGYCSFVASLHCSLSLPSRWLGSDGSLHVGTVTVVPIHACLP